ncbi:hypothetical protein GCM10017788_58170 [Amycolatopsis acidiphila]|nr:hypothetical protein GCM10017788_58170 [Amycolatopsis acidiphila]
MVSGLLLLHAGHAVDEVVLGFAREFPRQCRAWRGADGMLITWASNGTGPGTARPALAAHMAAAGAPSPDWYEARPHTFAGDPTSPDRSPGLFLVTSTVPQEEWAEFDAWFDTEHVPLLLRIPGWHAVRRYRMHASTRRVTHLALHYLDGREVLASPARANAGRTEWTRRLATRPWFRDNVRSFYQALDLTDRRSHDTP